MNNGNTIVGIIEASAALLVIFLAYLIKYKKQYNIIAGFDEKTCKDKNGLANRVGGTLLIAGGICFILAIIVIILPQYTKPVIVVYVLTIAIGTISAAIGGSKYIS
jgi:uncharacterized membrane protein